MTEGRIEIVGGDVEPKTYEAPLVETLGSATDLTGAGVNAGVNEGVSLKS